MVELEGTELLTPHPVVEPVSDTRAHLSQVLRAICVFSPKRLNRLRFEISPPFLTCACRKSNSDILMM